MAFFEEDKLMIGNIGVFESTLWNMFFTEKILQKDGRISGILRKTCVCVGASESFRMF